VISTETASTETIAGSAFTSVEGGSTAAGATSICASASPVGSESSVALAWLSGAA